jgi:hypothetical protein
MPLNPPSLPQDASQESPLRSYTTGWRLDLTGADKHIHLTPGEYDCILDAAGIGLLRYGAAAVALADGDVNMPTVPIVPSCPFKLIIDANTELHGMMSPPAVAGILYLAKTMVY